MRKRFHLADLLKPHREALALGIAAAVGEGIASLLEPWPLKVVLDNVLRSRPLPERVHQLVLFVAGETNDISGRKRGAQDPTPERTINKEHSACSFFGRGRMVTPSFCLARFQATITL
jgi:hypothetical protein